jgi:hypothetical protein
MSRKKINRLSEKTKISNEISENSKISDTPESGGKRRKSIRKEAIKTILEGQENRITITLKPNGEPNYEIMPFEPSKDKISFGIMSDSKARLELCAYDKSVRVNAFIFLNGERIMIDKYHWGKLCSSVMKMGAYFGHNRHKRRK